MAKKNSIKIDKVEVNQQPVSETPEKPKKKNLLDFSNTNKNFMTTIFAACGAVWVLAGFLAYKSSPENGLGYIFFGIVLLVVAIMYVNGGKAKKK
ncbi:MAG: hypothetical protein HUJ56_02040 [Erysipelotrichaceae bacterium]|nr:hypothetical protein [Erysipelotrichaceae bacterium]